MRKLATLAAAAGAGLVLTLIATTPSIAQNVHLNGGSKAEPIVRHDGGHEEDAGTTLVRFSGGIGVQPVSAGAGVGPTAAIVSRNIVRGVQPAAAPWKIADFSAKVEDDGHITARGRGLVFAGGNTVGTALVIAPDGTATASLTVFATLICENVAPFVERNTNLKGVPLAANGDFTIDDVLSPAPPADACATPVLLIRNTANLNWFSAGIQKFADH